ncbi:hypothetical protein MES4922_60154 [Mesorhizobium ventifaucium]|uniref:Uncharacterized protein n=1 Tax=Mesorhizobium ventifaucium TaxID=666020 RepID=A0ABM9ED35_9HYPH|nr:hypothetical protein MES4922_60154 [Mesorhizobium ventifaucium]
MDKKKPKLNLSERINLAFLYGDLNPTTDSEELKRRDEFLFSVSGCFVIILN